MKLKFEGHLVTFFMLALFLHGLAYAWLLRHPIPLFQQKESLVRIHLVSEMRAPLVLPKLKLPRPSRTENSRRKPLLKISPPPPLHLKEALPAQHPSSNLLEKSPSNEVEVEQPKGGKAFGNPEGIPGGKGSIKEIPAKEPQTFHPVLPRALDPRVLSRCQPVYPEAEREEGVEGTVQIMVVIGKDGGVKEARVLSSSGNASLDQAALESVKGCWQFSPAIQNGEAVESRITFPVIFRLQ